VHRSSGSYELVLGAVLFSLLGLIVDRAVGSTPLFMLAFALMGFVGAAVSIFYRYRAQMNAASPGPIRSGALTEPTP
jgi:F0F1-type ATP synthase assembly protein I